MNLFIPGKRPRLSVYIFTRNSADRIERLVSEAYEFADEVVVGVDNASRDDTFERVHSFVDVAFRFKLQLPGQLAPARLAVFDYATGDWILTLDDDESMEPTFDSLRDELMSDPQVTHHYLARKYIANLSPPEYVRVAPWYPDWQLKLFRNDRSLVWSPPRPHMGYYVQGLGNFEARTSILHFEPLWCSPEKRAIKQAEYRRAGSDGVIEKSLEVIEGLPLELVTIRPPPRPAQQRPTNKVHAEIRELKPAMLPGWKAEILAIDMVESVAAGASVVARVQVRNVGAMAWTRHVGHWPFLNLAFQLLDQKEQLLQRDGHRFPMPGHVAPGEQVLFIAPFTAPTKPGDYWLEWDLVSELECWFHECGSQIKRTPLKVLNASDSSRE